MQNLSNRVVSFSLIVSGINLGNVFIQVLISKFQCRQVGSIYNTPHLEIVAGAADSTSSASKIRLVLGGRAMISPDMRQSFLFSSRTVFMFSIHSESTGPSNISHFLSYNSMRIHRQVFMRRTIYTYSFW